MNPVRLPTTDAGATSEVTVRLTRAELRALTALRGKVTDPQSGHPAGHELLSYPASHRPRREE